MSVDDVAYATRRFRARRRAGPSPWSVFPSKRPLLRALALPVTGYGLSGAVVALCVGLLCRKLAEGVAGLGGVADALSPAVLLNVGLAATIVKSACSMRLAREEARIVSSAVGRVRRRTVARLLDRGAEVALQRAESVMTVALATFADASRYGCVGKLRALAQVVPLSVTLIALSWKLACIAAALVVPFFVITRRVRATSRVVSKSAQRLAEDLQDEMDDLVQNLDLWRTYGAGPRALAALDGLAIRAGDASARADAVRAGHSGLNEVVGAVALLGAYHLATAGWLFDGPWLACLAVIFLAFRPLRELSDADAWIATGGVALARLESVAGTPPLEATSRPGETSRVDIVHEVRTASRLRVSAVVPLRGGRPTTFQARVGQLVVLAGPTGSGKTSLLRCLLGLEPCRGRLWLDEHDVTNAPTGPKARPFAWVGQDAPVVTATLAENVELFGAAVGAREALRRVGATSLGERLQEVVGAGGRQLSGGERRQLSLARAVASGLPVLLLDEPTEGLDHAARARVVDAILRLRETHVLVAASHDRALLDVADDVIHLADEPHGLHAAE